MKKLIAMIAALGVVASMSLTSLAAVTVTSSDANAIKINGTAVEEGVYAYDDNVTFTTTTSATDPNNQTTILAIMGYDGTAASITTNSIEYINQSGTDKNFTFGLKTPSLTTGTVTVLMGGDKIAATPVGTITIATVEDGGSEEPAFTYGNVDGDERVTSNDAVVVLNHSSGLSVLTDANLLLAANVDGDEKITSNDAVVILNKSSGLIDKFPVEE